MVRRALVTLACVVGCSRRDPPSVSPVTSEVHDGGGVDASSVGLPHVRALADIAAHNGERVVVEGLYDVDRLGGKGGNLTWIILADGTRISRAYGAVPKELGLIEKQVRAIGRITAGPPDSKLQALMAPHLQVESIALSSGAPEPIAALPAPPLASAAPGLAARVDRWVSIAGTLDRLEPPTSASSGRVDAILRLADGALVRVEGAVEARYKPLVGKPVTVLGHLSMEKGSPGAYAIDLVIRGKNAVCAGVEARCGME